MAAEVVILRHDIEQERLHVVVERFGAQEQLGKEAEVLAVYGVLATVDLEEGILAVTIDLVARRMLSWALELDDVNGSL